MTIVCPITADTASLAIKSLKWSALLFGGRFEANLLIVPHATVDTTEVVKALSPLFQGVEVLPTHQITPDNVFQDVHGHFERRNVALRGREQYNLAWFWWEHDYTALRGDKEALSLIFQNRIVPGLAFQRSCRSLFRKADIFDVALKDRTSFPTLKDAHETVDFRIPIHLGCPDGSLIDRLMEERNSSETNVAVHEASMEYFTPPAKQLPGAVRIMIVTHKRDFDWLVYALRSIAKFARGFSGVTIAVPTKDELEIQKLLEPFDNDQWNYYTYWEVPDKGMIHHEERICSADEIVPGGTDFVVHFDADCHFTKPTHASQFFNTDGKPWWVWRPYQSLIELKGLKKVVGDCFRWKETVDRALRMDVSQYTMTRHGATIPIGFYKDFRDHVAKVWQMPFRDYVLSCQSTFPQGFCEFGALGGYAANAEKWKDKWGWRDCTSEPIPDDFIRSYWSHAPLRVDQPVGDGFFNGSPQYAGTNPPVRMTARQELEALLA